MLGLVAQESTTTAGSASMAPGGALIALGSATLITLADWIGRSLSTRSLSNAEAAGELSLQLKKLGEIAIRVPTGPLPAPTPKQAPSPEPKKEPAPSPKSTHKTDAMEVPDTCVSKARKLSQAGGCNFIAFDPAKMKGLPSFNEQRNPQASEYCRSVASNEPCEYGLYPPQAVPGETTPWAVFDAYDGHSLIECKCGYDEHIDRVTQGTGLPFEQRRSQQVLKDLVDRPIRQMARRASIRPTRPEQVPCAARSSPEACCASVA